MESTKRFATVLWFVLCRFRTVARTPLTLRTARVNIITWGIALFTAAVALWTDVADAAAEEVWWSWWYLFHGPMILSEIVMLHASIEGYGRLKARAAEQEEFQRIVARIEQS